MLETFKRMWLRWQAVAQGILWAQNAAIMTVAYFAGLGPVALVLKVCRIHLIDRAPADAAATTHWRPRSGKAMTMEEAGRQF